MKFSVGDMQNVSDWDFQWTRRVALSLADLAEKE
jgi:hypothetical protein